MSILGVIPARLASTRLPEKVLSNIAGKPMIQHVWERAKQAKNLDDVLIACDDQKIMDVAQGFGANVVLTSTDCPSGSDRIAQAVTDRDEDVIVNIQGDEPLIDPQVIDDLADTLKQGDAPMATVMKKITEPKEMDNPNVVKVIVDEKGYALYFSRASIPYVRDEETKTTCYKHLGLYAYRRDFLLEYTSWAPSRLEKIEKLEQLRVLEKGYSIKVIETEYESLGVDTPEDLAKVEGLLQS